MHRIGLILLSGLAASAIASSGAIASGIQWTSGPTVVAQGNTVTASGTMTGLAPGTVRIALTVRGVGSIVCVNPGGLAQATQTRATVPFVRSRVKVFATNGTPTFMLQTPIPQRLAQHGTSCANRNWLTTPTSMTFTSARLVVRQNGHMLFSQTFRL
jgi:hypothetical protein